MAEYFLLILLLYVIVVVIIIRITVALVEVVVDLIYFIKEKMTMIPMRSPQDIDLVVWPDGTWCFYEELEEMAHKSDDHRIVAHDSAEAEEIMAQA